MGSAHNVFHCFFADWLNAASNHSAAPGVRYGVIAAVVYTKYNVFTVTVELQCHDMLWGVYTGPLNKKLLPVALKMQNRSMLCSTVNSSKTAHTKRAGEVIDDCICPVCWWPQEPEAAPDGVKGVGAAADVDVADQLQGPIHVSIIYFVLECIFSTRLMLRIPPMHHCPDQMTCMAGSALPPTSLSTIVVTRDLNSRNSTAVCAQQLS